MVMDEKRDHTNFFQKIQPFIIVLLFLGFLLSFGLPAFSTFSKKNVMFVESSNNSDALEAPALTICVENVSIKSSRDLCIFQNSYSGGSPQDKRKQLQW